MKKSIFNVNEIVKICEDYDSGMSTNEIGIKYAVRNYILKHSTIRSNNSNGKKINLSDSEKKIIKKMCVVDKKTSKTISKELGYSQSFIEKYLNKNNLSRTKGEANTLYRTGRKLPNHIKNNMKIAQRKLVASGKRKQTGGICKTYYVGNIKCQGTYEKKYIDYLLENHNKLPILSLLIETITLKKLIFK